MHSSLIYHHTKGRITRYQFSGWQWKTENRNSM